MYSERPLAKDHDHVDSLDTEGLLSADESQEKLPYSLPSTTSRRNKTLKTYLHIAALAFYITITILLYTWSTTINGKMCDCDTAAIYCKQTESCHG